MKKLIIFMLCTQLITYNAFSMKRKHHNQPKANKVSAKSTFAILPVEVKTLIFNSCVNPDNNWQQTFRDIVNLCINTRVNKQWKSIIQDHCLPAIFDALHDSKQKLYVLYYMNKFSSERYTNIIKNYFKRPAEIKQLLGIPIVKSILSANSEH